MTTSEIRDHAERLRVLATKDAAQQTDADRKEMIRLGSLLVEEFLVSLIEMFKRIP